jgi:hypothetical protein
MRMSWTSAAIEWKSLRRKYIRIRTTLTGCYCTYTLNLRQSLFGCSRSRPGSQIKASSVATGTAGRTVYMVRVKRGDRGWRRIIILYGNETLETEFWSWKCSEVPNAKRQEEYKWEPSLSLNVNRMPLKSEEAFVRSNSPQVRYRRIKIDHEFLLDFV